jgi:hypothetical protein
VRTNELLDWTPPSWSTYLKEGTDDDPRIYDSNEVRRVTSAASPARIAVSLTPKTATCIEGATVC